MLDDRLRNADDAPSGHVLGRSQQDLTGRSLYEDSADPLLRRAGDRLVAVTDMSW
jgi:hypothetical protein